MLVINNIYTDLHGHRYIKYATYSGPEPPSGPPGFCLLSSTLFASARFW